MDLSALINIVYLLAALTFMLGIKLMCHPESAPGGNLIAGVGMVAAVIVTLMDIGIERFDYILGGLALGAAIGWRLVQQISAQKNPQILALLNSFGGLASLLVAWATFHAHPEGQGFFGGLALWATVVFGAFSFSGSLLVWARLAEKLFSGKAFMYSGQQLVATAIFIAILISGILFSVDMVAPGAYRCFAIFAVLALLLGMAMVIHVSSAELPVMICLLNSYTGIAVCCSGFMLQNPLLVTAGALVGASGIALTRSMCRDLGRPASYFLFGAFAIHRGR